VIPLGRPLCQQQTVVIAQSLNKQIKVLIKALHIYHLQTLMQQVASVDSVDSLLPLCNKVQHLTLLLLQKKTPKNNMTK
jgi:hypothetical protein